MSYWSVAILLISVSFLAYKNPPKTWRSRTSPQTQNYGQDSSSKSPPEKHQRNGSSDGPVIIQNENGILDDADSEGTPKANATHPVNGVPTFSLSDNTETDDEDDTEPEVPSFPAANSAQRASSSSTSPAFSSMPPPPRPAPGAPSSLMPPPARPVPTSRNLGTPSAPSSAASLRIPTTGPLPNRGPPINSAQRASTSTGNRFPSTNKNNSLLPSATAISTPNPRAKVQLTPGHSPMDWAALIRSPSANLTGFPPGTLQRIPPSQLKSMTGRKGKPAWSSWSGKVYNITPYLPFHPGGEAELMKAAGRDGTKLFMEVHPWVNWENMLGSCLVGILVSEEESVSQLDEMD